MVNVIPISRDIAQAAHDSVYGDFGVIDDFIAVVDGRGRLLQKAFAQARGLIDRYESVTIIRESRTLARSELRLGELFSQRTFGQRVIRPDYNSPDYHTPSARSRRRRDRRDGAPAIKTAAARSGHVFPVFEQGRYDLLRPKVSFDSDAEYYAAAKSYKTKRSMLGSFAFGADFHALFKASAHPLATPEYLSWHIENGDETSEPGLLHFDLGEAQLNPKFLKPKFLKAAHQRNYKSLEGSVTRTMSVRGGGTIVEKTDPNFFMQYASHVEKGTVRSIAENIMQASAGRTFYQTQDGDITSLRGAGWGEGRVPSYHCSPYMNAYGHVGNHLGRFVAIQSPQVSFLHPQEFQLAT